MREISSVALVLSEECNFSCPYCPQHRGKSTLTSADIRTFLDFLRPRLAEKASIGFYGGEPLLHWPLIEETVGYLRKDQAHAFQYSLTSNGSLLKKNQILYLKENRFELIISFDGQAQAHRDPSSVGRVQAALENLRRFYPHGYAIHSVFTPRTVTQLAASLENLLRQGHARLVYALDMIAPWRNADLRILKEQLERLSVLCGKHLRKTGRTPLENLRESSARGLFACFAGRDRLALLPDRTVWGCYMFYDLLGRDRANPDYRKYCYGGLERFISGYDKLFPAVGARYAELRQDFFFNKKKELCGLCNNLEHCAACPAVGALATGTLGMVPEWYCRIRRIAREVSSRFVEQRPEIRDGALKRGRIPLRGK
jgi:MoaA/NifB/PqqE/SkfB family radical SAM enzyme